MVDLGGVAGAQFVHLGMYTASALRAVWLLFDLRSYCN